MNESPFSDAVVAELPPPLLKVQPTPFWKPHSFLMNWSGLSHTPLPAIPFVIREALVPGETVFRRRLCWDKARREGRAGSFHMKMTEQVSSDQCSLCGCVTELLELPGRPDKFCLSCSADLATVILLGTEIDAATVAGRNTNVLVSEFNEISTRMLGRAQSAR
jgi:hypothetical protein